MKLWSWGRYPRIESEVSYPNGSWDVAEQIQQANGGNLIARGLGRSYGDSALAPSVIDMTRLDHLHSFDPDSGVVT